MFTKDLQQISKYAIELNPGNFSDKEKANKWIGTEPANQEAIKATGKRLGIELPKDVIELYKTSNGTSEILKQTFGGFDAIETIDWFKNLQPETIEAYSGMGEEYVKALSNAIVIAGANQPHMVLVIQPYGKFKKWRYWEFAHFIPGENEFKGIKKYLERLNDFLTDQIKNKETIITPIDYSIMIDAVQKQDWMTLYANATGTILSRFDTQHGYEPDPTLFGLCLLATSFLGNQPHFKTVLASIPRIAKNEALHDNLVIKKYIDAAEKKLTHTKDWQEFIKFKPRQNPKTVEDIEQQIREHRKDLLKPEEHIAKRDYQLHFLYEYGNAAAFVKLDAEPGLPYNFLKSARVFAYVGNIEKARQCINKYMADVGFDERIFEVYMDEVLFKLIEKE